MTLIQMPPRTFTAKLFEAGSFKVAATLDGFIDLATPSGTYQLSVDTARSLSDALQGSITDINSHCLYDRDVLLEK